MATRVSPEGIREIPSPWFPDSENETSWRCSLKWLKGRSLDGVYLVVSDDRGGLVNAVAPGSQGASWQRCQAHFTRSILAACPKAIQHQLHSRLRTTDCAERLNEQVRRRDRVIRVFPNDESAIRLIGAVLMDIGETWPTGYRHLNMEEYWCWN